MFQKILLWLQRGINNMLNKTDVQKVFGIEVSLGSKMIEALRLWTKMYENNADWLFEDEIISLNLSAAIAAEISRATTIEMQVDVSGSPRADYLKMQMDIFLRDIRRMVEMGAAKGGIMFKPYIVNDQVVVDFVQADQFYPIAFGPNGSIVSCVFAEVQQVGKYYYTRLEYHQMVEGNCEVSNRAFKSTGIEDLGIEVPLEEVEMWKDLEPEATITNIEKPLFAYFRYPLANNIDTNSPLGVSCYSRATDLIKQADIQWSDLVWEFESARRALYVDELAFGKGADGKPKLPNKRLYKALQGTGGVEDNLFEEWTPTIREANILNGLDAILRRIEFQCGLAYGVLSNPQTIDKTATELKISQQRSYATIKDVQKALQETLEHLVYAMDVWTTLGKIAPKGKYDLSFEFDDSIILDTEAQFTQDLRLVTSGIMSKVEFRMRNLGDDEESAKKAIEEVQAEQPEEDPYAEKFGI